MKEQRFQIPRHGRSSDASSSLSVYDAANDCAEHFIQSCVGHANPEDSLALAASSPSTASTR